MKFNENLPKRRKELNFSQEQLADKMNVTRQTISKWENGTAMPDLKKITELADFFDISMDELLGTPLNNKTDGASVNTDQNENILMLLTETTEQKKDK